MAIGNDTQPTIAEIREETLGRLGDFRSTLIAFAKLVAATADEFDPDNWEFDEANATYDELDNFHIGIQAQMDSLDTDYEDLKTCVLDLESDLETWADIKDEAEAEAEIGVGTDLRDHYPTHKREI